MEERKFSVTDGEESVGNNYLQSEDYMVCLEITKAVLNG